MAADGFKTIVVNAVAALFVSGVAALFAVLYLHQHRIDECMGEVKLTGQRAENQDASCRSNREAIAMLHKELSELEHRVLVLEERQRRIRDDITAMKSMRKWQ